MEAADGNDYVVTYDYDHTVETITRSDYLTFDSADTFKNGGIITALALSTPVSS